MIDEKVFKEGITKQRMRERQAKKDKSPPISEPKAFTGHSKSWTWNRIADLWIRTTVIFTIFITLIFLSRVYGRSELFFIALLLLVAVIVLGLSKIQLKKI